jgi:hypothetical protein
MADIIPNEQHSERFLCPTTLSNFREKQFTGYPHKVQGSRQHGSFEEKTKYRGETKNKARKFTALTLTTASCTMNSRGRLAQLVRAPALQAPQKPS